MTPALLIALAGLSAGLLTALQRQRDAQKRRRRVRVDRATRTPPR